MIDDGLTVASAPLRAAVRFCGGCGMNGTADLLPALCAGTVSGDLERDTPYFFLNLCKWTSAQCDSNGAFPDPCCATVGTSQHREPSPKEPRPWALHVHAGATKVR